MAKSATIGTDVSQVIASVTAANEAAAQASASARQALEARLAEIDEERETLVGQLRSLGGKASGKRARQSKRASNDTSLILAVATALSVAKGPLSPTEVCEAVQKAGYKTSSENYAQMVSQALSNLKNLRMGKSPVAVNAARGEWTAGSGMTRYLASPDDAVQADAT